MEARGGSWGAGFVALWLAVGCGGASTHNPNEEAGSGAVGGASGPTTSGGTAGTTAIGGTAVGGAAVGGGATMGGGGGGEPGRVSPLAGVPLDETFPWFMETHDGPSSGLLWAKDGVLDFELEGAPLEATLSTHNHLDAVQGSKGVTFRGKASRPLRLLVSVKSTLDSDYFGARDAGNDWPVAPAMLTTEWAAFEVRLEDLRPPEVIDPKSPPGFTLAFIVDEPNGPVQLWLDDVVFF
ncbi:MAG: hypothetical protein EOO73_23790 [Myxococcales bacterium]|nr:MAG: hypothetical protein EOO73_23790 [Myxococcales bacterium]